MGDERKNINPPTTSVTADVHHIPVVVVVSRVFQCFKIRLYNSWDCTLGWHGDIDSNEIQKIREIATESLHLLEPTWQSIFADLKVFHSSALGKLGFK